MDIENKLGQTPKKTKRKTYKSPKLIHQGHITDVTRKTGPVSDGPDPVWSWKK